MASSKPDLARAGTMQVTSKEGKSYLDRNLTEWKKDILMDHLDEDGEEEAEDTESPPAKPKMSKHTTMKGTAKEAATYLDGKGKPDEDAFTRGQQKKIEEISSEKPPSKKAKMARDSTMAGTAKEAKSLLAGEKLADTRQETKIRKGKANLKKASTMDVAKAEALAVYGSLDTSEGRSLRKRPAPKPAPPKRAGTMQKTAKEGKAYLKRGKKAKKSE